MREIKFRAWVKHAKVMVNGYDIVPYTCGSSFDNLNETIQQIQRDQILMQYTGLHDKNNKEIFEGDVVAIWAYGWENDVKDTNYGLFLKLRIDIVTLTRFPKFWLEKEQFGFDGEDLVDNENTEVIGNIYENPELLK